MVKPTLSDISVPLLSNVFTDENPLYKKLLFASITMLFCGLSLFQIGDRISYYMSEPTATSYGLEVQNRVRFPSITLCPADSFNGPSIENEKVKKNVSSVYELLNFGLDLNDIWNLTWNDVWTYTIACDYCSKIFFKPSDWRAQYTFLGLCYTLDFPQTLPWNGKGEFFRLNFNHKMHYNFKVFVHDIATDISYAGASELRYYRMHLLTSTTFHFLPRIITYENVTRRPCFDSKSNNCVLRCYDEEVLLHQFCRLPFITPDRSNLSLCSTPEDFQAAYPIPNNNMVAALLTNAKQCKKRCGKLCISHRYDFRLAFANYPPQRTAIYATPHGHSVKVVTERLLYQFDSLMSDIGGTVGLFLGISLLTVAELVDIIYLMLFHKQD